MQTLDALFDALDGFKIDIVTVLASFADAVFLVFGRFEIGLLDLDLFA